MKKIILSIALTTLSFFSFSQYIDYGLRLNTGYSTLGDKHKGFAIDGGLYINADIKDRIGIGAEILLGGRFVVNSEERDVTSISSITGNDITTKVTDRSTVIASNMNIPLYIYFPFSKHLTLELGGVLSSSGSGRETTSSTESGSGTTKFKSILFNPKGGLLCGIKFRPNQNTEVGIRYMATSKGEPEENVNSTDNPNSGTNFSTSSVIQFNLGFLINW